MASQRYCTRCLTTFDADPDRCTNLACARARPPDGWSTLLQPGDVLDRHYRIDQALALGGAGLTYRVRELDAQGEPHGPDLAVKVLYAQRDQGSFLQRLANEAQILQGLDHPNLIECRGFVQRSGQAPYLVTLFEHGGNLGEHLERHGLLAPRVAAGILRQVMLALHVAHQRGVVHRDLKPENVLLRQRVEPHEIPDVRVADFGIAKVEAIAGRLTRQGAFVGTPEFAAPEQFQGRTPTAAADVYASGALLYTLLTGLDLVNFADRLDVDRCYDELAARLPPRAPDHLSGPGERALVQAFFDGTMALEPDRRWSVPHAIQALDALIAGRAEHALNELAHAPDAAQPAADAAPVPTEPNDGPIATGGGLSSTIVGLGAPLLGLLLGAPTVLILLVLSAFTLGYLRPAPTLDDATPVAAVQVTAPSDAAPRDLTAARTPAEVAERTRILQALADAAPQGLSPCAVQGTRTIDLRISGRGHIQRLAVDGLDAAQQQCVERLLRRARIPRDGDDDVTVRLTMGRAG